MSTKADDTFMTGGGEQNDAKINRQINDTHMDLNLALSRPHLSPTGSGNISARQTILSAVETLELENEELRKVNNRVMAEMEDLRQENDQLRKDLDLAIRERDQTSIDFGRIEEDNNLLLEKIRLQNVHFSEENKKFYALESSLKQDNDMFRKQCEMTKSQLSGKDLDIRALTKELDAMKNKLEKAMRKNTQQKDVEAFHEIEMLKAMRKNTQQKDVEAFHEIEMLKAERKDLVYERDETSKINKKLKNDLKKLEISLEEKTAELRNENRRHSLLTKEFNSLLEENNNLKMQLRRRRLGNGSTGAKDDALVETTVELTPNQTRRFNYTTSLSRDTSPLSSAESNRGQREPLMSSRLRMNREKTSIRGDYSYHSAPTSLTVQESEEEFTLDRINDKQLMIKAKSTGSRSGSESSPPPEGLPNISGGKTWRP